MAERESDENEVPGLPGTGPDAEPAVARARCPRTG
jgi:hypothetical protein